MVKCAVMGCGQLGVKIAGELAFHGHKVKLYDSNTEALDSAHSRIENDKKALLDEGLITSTSFIGRILCLSSLSECVKDAEFIFEAVIDDLDVKEKLFQDIEVHCDINAVIASNTLQLDIGQLASKLEHPARVVGLRFLYPVYFIPEVEITLSKDTSTVTTDKVRCLVQKMGKVLFFRSPGNPLILTYEQREARKQGRLEEVRGVNQLDPWRGGTGATARLDGQTDNEYNDDKDDKDCAICMDKPRDSLLSPCHHLVTCNACAQSLLSRRDGCPICRKDISQVIHVYHS